MFLSLGPGLSNLGSRIEEAPGSRPPTATSARAALVERNAGRVARSISSIEALLREGQRLAAREAALRCLVIEHPSVRCAELYVATLDDMEATRAQQVLRRARDARLELLTLIAGTTKWKDCGSDAADEAACRVLMADLRPFIWTRTICACAPCQPLLNDANHVDGVAVRSVPLPACARHFLSARLARATRIGDQWNLDDVMAWQDVMESATLRFIDSRGEQRLVER